MFQILTTQRVRGMTVFNVIVLQCLRYLLMLLACLSEGRRLMRYCMFNALGNHPLRCFLGSSTRFHSLRLHGQRCSCSTATAGVLLIQYFIHAWFSYVFHVAVSSPSYSTISIYL